jgi:hypothetical protein
VQTDHRRRRLSHLSLGPSQHPSMRRVPARRILSISVMAHPIADAMLGYGDGAGMGNVSRARGAGGAAVGALRRGTLRGESALERRVVSSQLGTGRGSSVRRLRHCTYTQRVVVVVVVARDAAQLHSTLPCATPGPSGVWLGGVSHVSRRMRFSADGVQLWLEHALCSLALWGGAGCREWRELEHLLLRHPNENHLHDRLLEPSSSPLAADRASRIITCPFFPACQCHHRFAVNRQA